MVRQPSSPQSAAGPPEWNRAQLLQVGLITDKSIAVVFLYVCFIPELDRNSVATLQPHRAQRLLIRAIEEMSFQTKVKKKKTVSTLRLCTDFFRFHQTLAVSLPGQVWHEAQQKKEKAVRIVSTGRQGRNPMWVSVEEEKTKSSDSGGL